MKIKDAGELTINQLVGLIKSAPLQIVIDSLLPGIDSISVYQAYYGKWHGQYLLDPRMWDDVELPGSFRYDDRGRPWYEFTATVEEGPEAIYEQMTESLLVLAGVSLRSILSNWTREMTPPKENLNYLLWGNKR